ncbi:leucine-rich repeat neuronal protein 4 [Empidonax traillii]|uniref:leucine-rich repeat neuronal protein 4 n=1 Tax=Empidonax traillii TaxID=164674 RepID=UPI000FFD6EB2|nr:leucine-rich repeat neuronal protein 4 [Empidonax traillii]
MSPGLLILSLLVGSTTSGPVSRAEPAASRDVTTFFQLAQEDPWENVNLTSMSCEHRKNRTWITLQLTNSSLTTFPVCLPEALETLDLSNNLLEELNGSEVANLPRLRVLSLRHNHLWAVSWGPEALSSLLKLDLSFNKLSSVPSCHSSALPNLRWLSLAGNPLLEIQPLAFSCSPQLQVLNLSATLLGQEDSRGIRDSAFAISTAPREATDRPGNSINVLDLSGTFLEKIQPEWTRDLPSLRSLHLTKMPRLRSLHTDFVKSMPGLQELHCQDSPSLSFVRTEMFDSAPHLSHLSFENCNLSSFNPWDTNSSDGITINLSGNPLFCDCQLSWLLSKPKRVVLQKAGETFCTSQEEGGRPPTLVSLQELYNKCQSGSSNGTVLHSNTASPDHDALNFTSYDATAAVTTDWALLSRDTSTSSLIHGDLMSATASPMLTEDTSTSSLIHGDLMSATASPMLAEDTSISSLIHGDLMSAKASPMLTEDTSISSLIHGDLMSATASPVLNEDTSISSLIQGDLMSATASPTLTRDAYTSSLNQGDAMSTTVHPVLAKDTSTSSLIQRDAMSTALPPTEPMLTVANSSSHQEEAVSKSTSNPPSFASVTSFPVFLKELFAQLGSTSQTGTEQPKGELRTTDTTFPQEAPSSQTTSRYSTGGTGTPNTTERSIHSTASLGGEGTPQSTPQPSPPQLNSSRSSAGSEPAPTRAPAHYVDDYDYDEQPKETPVQVGHLSCDYNPCRHLQKPCSELQSVSQCLCPGMSMEDEVPDPPRLSEVTEVTDSSALIHWCAPNSVVHTYELVLLAQGNEDRQFVMDNIYPTARQYTLYNLSPYTTYNICVTASNKAGSSQITAQEFPGNSCTRFKTKPSYKSVFVALSAASGFFLITTIVLSACLCRACKKPHSEQYGTHLVSYKNPAFDYPLKIQTSN